MKVDLSRYSNDWYSPGRKISVCSWYLLGSVFVNTLIPFPSFFKVMLLRLFGAKIGNNVVIKPNVKIKYPWNLKIGNNTWIGEDVWIDNLANVNIGHNCCLSQGVYVLTGNHNYKTETFDLIIGEINIMDAAWVGAKSILCPSVTVGENSVLTVGSVATNDLESNYIYQGNPAVKKKTRFK